MNAVHKYPLLLSDQVSILMPEGAEPLCVQLQNGLPYLWARVEPERPLVHHNLRIAGTGHKLDQNVGAYIGTFQLEDGALVFHVFKAAN